MNKKVVSISSVFSILLMGSMFVSAGNFAESQTEIVPKNSPKIPKHKVVICDKEVRLCGDGSLMLRDMVTCEWLKASCIPTQTINSIKPIKPKAAITPGKLGSPKPTSVFSFVHLKKAITKILKPSMPIGKIHVGVKPTSSCIVELRMCPNGLPMPRGADCKWLSDKCSSASDIVAVPVLH